MYLTECPSSIWGKVKIKCDQCGVEYNGRAQSSRDQLSNLGHHECRKCVSSRVGKKVQADNPDLGKKISAAKKGVPLSEAHKTALRGRVVTAETKSKMSESAKRRVRNPRVCDAMQDCVCADCGISYKGRVKTVSKQKRKWGVSVCCKCKSSRIGKLVGEKMQEVYRQNFLTNNPMSKQECRDKISEALSGRLFSEERKLSLRKPKSNTEKIKEAANRPEERERRSRRMLDRVAKFDDPARGMFKSCKRGYFESQKTKEIIYYRSGLEKEFLNLASASDKITSISAAGLCLPYVFENAVMNYLPDFSLHLSNGAECLVEIKCPYLFYKDDKTKAKLEKLKVHCEENGLVPVILISKKEIESWLATL